MGAATLRGYLRGTKKKRGGKEREREKKSRKERGKKGETRKGKMVRKVNRHDEREGRHWCKRGSREDNFRVN